jgi:hypothetical protein
MSWYSRTWAACRVVSCEAEVLRTKADEKGWLQTENGGWLCPIHRPYSRMPDAARAAAGERDDE